MGFNSTMVRLKVLTKRTDAPSAALFQFHNGSIKKVQRSRQMARQCFNSTMVRLKACTFEKAFQFHNGSIKSEC